MPYYKGTFNWYGEIHTLHTKTRGKNTAYMKFTYALSKKLQRIPNAIRAYFGGQKDNYKIEEVKEWEERIEAKR